jgi:hypothetical protein
MPYHVALARQITTDHLWGAEWHWSGNGVWASSRNPDAARFGVPNCRNRPDVDRDDQAASWRTKDAKKCL